MKPLNLDELTVEQKIGQLFVVRNYVDDEDRAFVYEMLEKRAVGGVQVRVNEDCAAENARIREHADYPVLICADMEKGFPISPYQIPSMLSLGITGDEELAYQVGAVTAIEAKRHGFNTVWGPVVDMKNGNAMCKIPRILGTDPEHVSRMGTAILRGYTDNGMIASAKHWPVPLDEIKDGHAFKSFSQMTEQDILDVVIKPYLHAMKEGVLPAVMSGHYFYPRIDDTYPATLSEKLIGILRSHGFDGLIFTDSFAMVGILHRFGTAACYGLAIKAGNDMILPNYRDSFKTSYNLMLQAYRDGIFTEERLNEAVRRVITAQNATMKEATATEVSEYQKDCIRRVAQDGICLHKNGDVATALDKDSKKLFVIMVENVYRNEDGFVNEISDGAGLEGSLPRIRQSILSRFPGSDIKVICQYPSIPQTEAVCRASTKADEVIYMTFCSSGAYRIGENLTENVVNLMDSMSEKISAVIHLGNPYAMERIPRVPRIIMSIGSNSDCIDNSFTLPASNSDSIDNTFAVLAEEYEPKGKIPLELKLK